MLKVEGDLIINHRGDVMAQKIDGTWETKDDFVLDFIESLDKKKVRARKKDGKFIGDDPATPNINEAWK